MIYREEEEIEVVIYQAVPPPGPPPAKEPRRVPWQGFDQGKAIAFAWIAAPIALVLYVMIGWWQTSMGNALLCALIVVLGIGFYAFMNWAGKRYLGPLGERIAERIINFVQWLNKK